VNPKDLIRQYIQTELVKDKKQAALGDTDPLIDSGIIDSLGIMKLIGFLEDKMAIQITDEELTPENFSTIESISGLVQKKKP
jgi:acyl carrier protein